MRLILLASPLLVACAHAAPLTSTSNGYVPVGHRGCAVFEAPRPEFLLDPVRLGPAAGSLPYTIDGHHSAYTLVHRR